MSISATNESVLSGGASTKGSMRSRNPAVLRHAREGGLAGDEHHVAAAAHRDVRRLRLPKGGDLPILDQDVVERQQKLPVRRRPVAGLTRDDEDVPVEAHLLAVVLA